MFGNRLACAGALRRFMVRTQQPVSGVAPTHRLCLAQLESCCKANIVCALRGKRLVPTPFLFPAAMAMPPLRRGHAGRAHSHTPDIPPYALPHSLRNDAAQKKARVKINGTQSRPCFFLWGSALRSAPSLLPQGLRSLRGVLAPSALGSAVAAVGGVGPPLSPPFGGSRAPFPSGGRGAAQPPLKGRIASPRSFFRVFVPLRRHGMS